MTPDMQDLAGAVRRFLAALDAENPSPWTDAGQDSSDNKETEQ